MNDKLNSAQEAYVVTAMQVLLQRPSQIGDYLHPKGNSEAEQLTRVAAERARDFQNARFNDPAFIATARRIIEEVEADGSQDMLVQRGEYGSADMEMRLCLVMPEAIELSGSPQPGIFDDILNPDVMHRAKLLGAARAVVAIDAARNRIMSGRGLHDYEPSMTGRYQCRRCGDIADYESSRKRILAGELCGVRE